MSKKISAVYKIANTITGDFYIGSSKNVKRRWASHKITSTWKKNPNNPLYQDMQKYGLDKFVFEILEEVEEEYLKEKEQEFIEKLHPTYNDRKANGWDIERRKEYQKEYKKTDKYKEYHKEYKKTDKYKEYHKEYHKEYQKSDKYKEYQKEYKKTDKYKESLKKAQRKYQNQLCLYNGETLTLCALSSRFKRKGIPHPTQEAKKYIIKEY